MATGGGLTTAQGSVDNTSDAADNVLCNDDMIAVTGPSQASSQHQVFMSLLQSVPTEFICSICSEVLKDPLVAPCGHNYCYKCITTRIKVNSRFHTCLYPSCNEPMPTADALHPNVELSEEIDKYHKQRKKYKDEDVLPAWEARHDITGSVGGSLPSVSSHSQVVAGTMWKHQEEEDIGQGAVLVLPSQHLMPAIQSDVSLPFRCYTTIDHNYNQQLQLLPYNLASEGVDMIRSPNIDAALQASSVATQPNNSYPAMFIGRSVLTPTDIVYYTDVYKIMIQILETFFNHVVGVRGQRRIIYIIRNREVVVWSVCTGLCHQIMIPPAGHVIPPTDHVIPPTDHVLT